ncbi:MAG: LacI family DNA-binding transcriptional regulator [Lapillicoccus sp.]
MTAKRPTIADIAQRAGVSTGAVSYALNGRAGVSPQTRDRILHIADEIGWRPSIAARSLSGSRSHAVGLVIARTARTLGVEPFFMQFIAGVESVLSAQQTALLLQVVPDHAAANTAARQWWAERRVDGVIVTDLWVDDHRIPTLLEIGVPAVIVGRPHADVPLPGVWSDDGAAVESVVDYLVALGHRRIARVAGLERLEHTQVRTDAFLAATSRHGIAAADIITTDYTREEGARATRRLLTSRQPPTAITYDNDVMAVAGLGVAREMSISVPDQLSIVAGDDSQLCVLVHPSLTSLSRDITAYGANAARLLLTHLDGGAATSFQDATAHLIPRGSTATAPDVTGGDRHTGRPARRRPAPE